MITYTLKIFVCLCVCSFSTGLCGAIAEVSNRANKGLQEQQNLLPAPVQSSDEKSQGNTQHNSVIIIEKVEGETKVRVDTKGYVAPYLGASKNKPPSDEVMHIISKEERAQNLKGFYLETGVGVNVHKNINLDLGYRFEHNPSLIDEYERDNGQIRFGIKFNY